jgi:hypothetical protein
MPNGSAALKSLTAVPMEGTHSSPIAMPATISMLSHLNASASRNEARHSLHIEMDTGISDPTRWRTFLP